MWVGQKKKSRSGSPHPVSHRRPGSQLILRSKARADATSMLYLYSQILASSRGGKQGGPRRLRETRCLSPRR
jgi:hypothetical protein